MEQRSDGGQVDASASGSGSRLDDAIVDERWFARFAVLPGTVLCLLDDRWQYAAVSRSVTRTLGYQPAEWLELGPAGTVHRADADALRDAWRTIADEPGGRTRARCRARHHDGSWRWVDVVATNLVDDPEVDGVLVEIRDVTDRLEAEEALRQSEVRYRALVSHAADAIAILDEAGTVRFAGPSTSRVLGYSAEELTGRGALELVHPDDRPLVEASLAEVLADEDDHPMVVEARIWTGWQEWRWVEGTVADLRSEPAVAGLVVSFRDATQRHLTRELLESSERRFRALVSASTDVIVVSDGVQAITYVSPSIEAVLGWTTAEFQMRYAELVHPDDLVVLAETSTKLREAPGNVVRNQGRLRHRDGRYRTFEVTATNLLDDPDVSGVVSNLRDVTDRLEAEDARRASEERFRALVESSVEVAIILDSEGTVTWAAPTLGRVLGVSPDQAVGTHYATLLHEDDRAAAQAAFARLAAGEELDRRPLTVRAIDDQGRWRTLEVVGSNLEDNPHVGGLLVSFHDVSDRLAAEADTARLTEIIEASSDLVAVTDREGRCRYMNQACMDFFSVDADELDAFRFDPFAPEWVQAAYRHEVIPALRTAGIWSGEMAYVRDGRQVPVSSLFIAHRDERGELELVSSVTRDISERKAFEARLEHEATHDPLTELPNRTLLLDRLGMALARADRHDTGVAVLFLDLDHFKVVNDSLGHGIGDRLLVAAAERLRAALRPGDTVARFGGDEFVVLCEDLGGKDDALLIAERVDSAMGVPFQIDDVEVFVTVSTGISYTSNASDDPESLVRDADAAMYQAKGRGRSQWAVFDRRMREMAVDRLEVESSLRHALTRHELRLAYQPEVDLATGRIVGVEALLRWEHPQRGLLLPGEFIGVAEETGLIVRIGTWVLDRACRQVQRWHAEHPDRPPLTAAVNLSSRQLAHPELVEDVARVIEDTGIDPERVVLEITESVLMEDVEASRTTLDRLKALGVLLVVDDFGTGYSSLAYLRRFPVDMLKIDQSFIDGLGEDPSDSAIVAAVVNLAHTLGLQAVGEGVETEEQLAELRALECDLAQGYLLARPLDPDTLSTVLEEDPTF